MTTQEDELLYVVKAIEEEEKMRGRQKGTVMAVGGGKKDEIMTVKVGDTILYSNYGIEIEIEGKSYLIMRESDILAMKIKMNN